MLDKNLKCMDCPLYQTAKTNCLMGTGPQKAEVMVVGEAPGASEDEGGQPFIGKSGELLTEVLEKHGFSRKRVYITNAVHCRPPDNRTPTKSQVKKCKRWLDEEIERVDPKYILLLGNTPLLSLTGGVGIKKKRGIPIEMNGRVFLPTYHPAYVLRDIRFYAVFDQDIRDFAQIVTRGGPRVATGLRYRIVEDEKTLRSALRDIQANSLLSFDTETSGLNPFAPGSWVTSVGIGTRRYQWCIPLQHPQSIRYNNRTLQTRTVRALGKAIRGRKLVAHNGKFDTKWMWHHYGEWWNIDYDTMLAHYNADENSLHGLDILSQRYFDAMNYDIPLEEKHGFGPLDRHCQYLGLDLLYTRKLYFKTKTMLKSERTWQLFNKLTMPVAQLFAEVECTGFYMDRERLSEAHTYWSRKEKFALRRLHKAVPSDRQWKNKKKGTVETGINWGSPDQVADVLFNRLKLKPLDITPGGKPSTSESVLLRLAKQHRVPKLILEYREAQKNKSTFIEAWQRQCFDNRVYPSFKLHGTVTGRPSCTDPNFQQTPRDKRLRSLVSAPPGYVLVEADFSQVELRVTAELSQDDALVMAYHTGEDVHSKTVRTIFGIMNPTGEERKKGKAINFGFIYGMGWRKFLDYARDNYGVEFSPAEGKRIRKEYFRLYSDLPDWHDRQRRFAARHGYVLNLIGRKRRLPQALGDPEDRRTQEAYRQAINSPVQSFASDMNLMSAVQIRQEIDPEDCRIVGTIHDAILMEVKIESLGWVTRKVKSIMEAPKLLDEMRVELSIPIISELKKGNWGAGEEIEFAQAA